MKKRLQRTTKSSVCLSGGSETSNPSPRRREEESPSLMATSAAVKGPWTSAEMGRPSTIADLSPRETRPPRRPWETRAQEHQQAGVAHDACHARLAARQCLTIAFRPTGKERTGFGLSPGPWQDGRHQPVSRAAVSRHCSPPLTT
jgi:hypothetical protein